MEHALITISSLYQYFGLQVNIQKTGYGTTQYPTSFFPSFQINGVSLKEVDQFIYLGSTLSSDCSFDNEINSHMHKASSAFGRHRKRVFENKNLKVSTKVAIYNVICASILLYGAETWTPYR